MKLRYIIIDGWDFMSSSGTTDSKTGYTAYSNNGVISFVDSSGSLYSMYNTNTDKGWVRDGSSSSSSSSSSGGGQSITYKTISDYQDDWQAADARGDEAGKKAAHEGAEALRAAAGYSGGIDGSSTIDKDKSNVFVYSSTHGIGVLAKVTGGADLGYSSTAFIKQGGSIAYDTATGKTIRDDAISKNYTVTWTAGNIKDYEYAPGAGSLIELAPTIIIDEVEYTPIRGRENEYHDSSGNIVIITPPTNPTVIKYQYEYVYGIKELQLNSTTNEKNAIWVSQPIRVEGNIAQISLNSSEIHPLFTPPIIGISNLRHSSIEWYISYVENPSDNDWVPILPSYEERVINELLFIENNQANFRFPALVTKDINVYENGILYDERLWQIKPNGMGVTFVTIDNNADYTVNYWVNEDIRDPFFIDIVHSSKKPQTYMDAYNNEGELFVDGLKSNCVATLKYTPYIDYERINNIDNFDPNKEYRPIQVFLEDGIIVIPQSKTVSHVQPYDPDNPSTICTKNMTDYVERIIPSLKPYDLTKDESGKPNNMVFQYYQDGNKIIFTENFQPSSNITNIDIAKAIANVRIKYQYLVSSIRVKAIMRRTGLSNDAAFTPVIENYSLEFKTLE